MSVFHRGCGHITQGICHSDTCDSRSELRTDISPRQKSVNDLLCLYLEKRPQFVVGKCLECLEATENGNPNIEEPTRQIYHSEKAKILNPGVHAAKDIATLAAVWRGKVEEAERHAVFLEVEGEEEAYDVTRRMRSMDWDTEWAEYRASFPRGTALGLPKVLDLTEETEADESLLQVASPAPGAQCSICQTRLDMPLDGEEYADPRSMACRHAMHMKCLVQALIHTRACPVCQTPVNFVLKNSFDDPKFRWHEGKKKWLQVDGYIDFRTGLEDCDSFEPYGKEDRWGDRI